MREGDVNDFVQFLAEIQRETDRGAALVGAALIDQRLKETLRAFMIDGDIAGSLLEGGNAPLGAFSSRISAAFSLGLIDEYERAECEFIRKIRNKFAHHRHGLKFSDQQISSWCDCLKSDLPGGRENFKGTPRHIFNNAVVLITMRLTYRAEWVAQDRRVTRSWSQDRWETPKFTPQSE